jgi:hypothetical protein
MTATVVRQPQFTTMKAVMGIRIGEPNPAPVEVRPMARPRFLMNQRFTAL